MGAAAAKRLAGFNDLPMHSETPFLPLLRSSLSPTLRLTIDKAWPWKRDECARGDVQSIFRAPLSLALFYPSLPPRFLHTVLRRLNQQWWSSSCAWVPLSVLSRDFAPSRTAPCAHVRSGRSPEARERLSCIPAAPRKSSDPEDVIQRRAMTRRRSRDTPKSHFVADRQALALRMKEFIDVWGHG